MTGEKQRILIITGATSTGKSSAALEAAEAMQKRGLDPFIISMDAVQVYKYMDIGSDKLPPEKRRGIPHHMIDVVEPDHTFSAAEFKRRSDEIIRDQGSDESAAIVAGGTAFYMKALLQGLFPGPAAHPELRQELEEEAAEQGLDSLHRRLEKVDPESAARIHRNDRARTVRALEVFEITGEPMSSHLERHEKSGPQYDALVMGLSMDRSLMYERIDRRAEQMVERGLVQEVERLRAMGYGPDLPSQQALSYRQVHMMLDKKIDMQRALYLMQRDTRRFAKRQLTWLRKEPRLEWVDAEKMSEIAERAAGFMEN